MATDPRGGPHGRASPTVRRISGQAHRPKRRSRSRRLLTRALPLTVLALGAAAIGIYEAGAPARAEHAVVVRYVSAWRRRNYAGMYALLDETSRGQISQRRFTAQMRRAEQTATITALGPARLLSIKHGLARVRFTIHTGTFGTLHATARIRLVGGGGGARVQFSSALLFPGLKPGERLSRKSTLGTRGTLLASNGQVLAAGSALSTQIPEIANAIVGTLGPIPESERSMYAADGYPKRAYVGQDGLEQIFERQLAGRPGGELLAGKHVIATAAPGNGAIVSTTINSDLELDALDALGSHYAGVTVMNAANGDIEAAAGLAFTALQPPGSTFKIITSAAALQAGLTTLNTYYPMESSVDIDGFTMQNAAGEVCGGTLINAFATSCDTTFAPLGDQVGAQRLVAEAQLFGFDEPTGIASALTSTIPTADTIGGTIAVGASAIGQGLVQATTLEMADVGAAIADGGRRPLPTLDLHAKPRYVKVTTPKVAGEIQEMMEAVVRYGTGTAAQIPGVTVAGKTGTAELRSTAGKKNDAKATDAWFVAYAPVPDPKVVVCALFPNAGYGGDTAAPVVRELLEQALGLS
jgi:penicillin-binding protein A